MHLGNLVEAKFLRRLNRFVCEVSLEGVPYKVLLRNTGRLSELLYRGNRVYVKEKTSGKYRYELVLATSGGTLVCLDSHLPPELLVEHLKATPYPWRLTEYRREFKIGKSRFDLLINGRILVETKSVNLVRGGVALFPDAPTLRGLKHIRELIKSRDSYEPAIVFVIQRSDAHSFSPNWEMDKEFSRALKQFYEEVGNVFAFSCHVSVDAIHINKEVPVSM